MLKIVHLEPYFPTGELTVQPVLLWANGRPCYEDITKTASVGREFFKTITPVPGHSFVYVLAVSAWERYGENRNGDGFPEFPYKEDHDPPWIAPGDVLTQHYKSFEKYGKNYRHHMNDNPKKAVGDVVKAFWNSAMHRVELLVDLENDKAPDLAERIAAGEFPPVSMGTKVPYDVCFTAGTLVHTSEGHKPIETIVEKDLVYTHKGNLCPVTAQIKQKTNNLMTLQGWGTLPISVTKNHPFLILKRKHVDARRIEFKTETKKRSSRASRIIKASSEWCAAEDIILNDYLGTPIDPCASEDVVGTRKARLLGYYTGDGCAHYYRYKGERTPSHVVLTLNSEQPEIIESIRKTAAYYIADDKIRLYESSEGTKAVRLYLSSRDLIDWCIERGGQYSYTKRLDASVFTWSREEKLNFLGGYIDTDGCYYARRGYTVLNTINHGLALDVRRLGLSAGIPISINYTKTSSHGYEMFIPAAFSALLSEYSDKVQPFKIAMKPKLRGFSHEGYWWTPVRKIEEIDLTEEQEVYNLSVENDESYLVEGVAVHNCTICGNRAPTRAQYCNHLKFQMREIVDGKKVAALNPRPRYFDLSWVFKGADPNAVMMKKVANELPYELISGLEAGEYLDEMSSNKLAAHKLAVIDKIVQGLPIDAKTEGIDPNELETLRQMRDLILAAGARAPAIPDDTLNTLSDFPLKKVLSTSAASGMTLSTPELMKILTHKTDPNIHPTEDELDKTVLMQRPIMELFEDIPQLLKQIEDAGTFDVDASNVDMKVASLLKPYMEKRSGIGEYLKRQLVPEKYRTGPPYTTQFTMTDPATGMEYSTTRGAAIRAHDEIAKRNLYKVLGGSALLGGAYGLIGRGLTARGLGKLKPLAALTLGGLGMSQWPDMGPHYMTDQGVPVPTLTEIAPSKYASAKSLALPLLGTLGAMTAMGHDYMSRVDRGIPIGHPALPASRRALDTLEESVHEHPVISAVLGTLLLRRLGGTQMAQGLKKHIAGPVQRGAIDVQRRASEALKAFAGGQKKISSWLGPEIISKPTDTVLLPVVNMDKIAERLGEIIVEG
jgi:hypothetical protein